MSKRTVSRSVAWVWCLLALSLAVACSNKKSRPPATTSNAPTTPQRPMPAPTREAPLPTPRDDTRDSSLNRMEDPDNIGGRTLDEINANSPLADVRFDFDSAVLRDDARAMLDRHAEWLRRYSRVTLLVEGHCDERGTVEYNLALGERRAAAIQSYLVSLGIASSRLKTISYGKEFPLDPGHTEDAWAKNRRGHFQFTGK